MSKGAYNPMLTSLKPTSSAIEPPRSLQKYGLNLWHAVMKAYRIDDVGGRELLTLACQALDRVESLSEQIRIDGEVFRDGTGRPKTNPTLRDELHGRMFVAKCLERLGVTSIAPDSPSGRPRKAWRGPNG
jgi:hypothetical protein